MSPSKRTAAPAAAVAGAAVEVRVAVEDSVVGRMREVGVGCDWAGGEPFQGAAIRGTGDHVFYFEAIATDGSGARIPSDAGTAFSGPVVTP